MIDVGYSERDLVSLISYTSSSQFTPALPAQTADAQLYPVLTVMRIRDLFPSY